MRTRWLIVAGLGVALVIASALFWRTGLERSDQWASVLSFFVGTLSLTLGLVQTVRGARQPETETTSVSVSGNENTFVFGRAKIVNKYRRK